MQIKQKLIFGYLIIALLAELVGYFGFKATKIAQNELKQFIHQNIPLIRAVEELKYAESKIISETSAFTYNKNQHLSTEPLRKEVGDEANKDRERQLNQIKAAKQLYNSYFKKLEKTVSDYFPESKLGLDKVKASGDKIFIESDQLIKLKIIGSSQEKIAQKTLRLKELENSFMKDINYVVDSVCKQNKKTTKIYWDDLYSRENFYVFGIIILGASVLIGAAISISILNQIQKLQAGAAEISNGKLRTKREGTTKDELSELADTFNIMTDNLPQNTEYVVNICESIAESLIVVTPNGVIKSINQATCELLAYAEEELVGQPVELVFAEAESLFKGTGLDEFIQKGFIRTKETTYLSKDGREISVLFSGSVMRGENGTIQGIVCVAQDITERKRAKQEIENSLSLLRATLESTADGILVLDRDQKIQTYNQKFVEMWHIPEQRLTAGNANQVLEIILERLKDPVGFLFKARKLFAQLNLESYDVIEFKDGRIFESYAWPQQLNGNVVGKVFSFRDITERRQAEEIMRYQAWYDQLTGLPNRILFNQQLSRSLDRAYQSKGMLAVMFLDLDRFKIINDTLGHAVGDRLLECVAQRLTNCLREGDTIARWGGDEFTVLLHEINFLEDAIHIAERILNALKPAFNLEGQRTGEVTQPLHISSSIGIALYPSNGEDAETLIKNADAALYRAKEQGRNNYQLFTAAMHQEAAELLVLENSMYRALEQEEFVVYYQPQVNTATEEIIRVEALARWQHPELGLVLPTKFIPLAEETGLILPLGEWVLRTACLQNKAWQEAGCQGLRVAVNLSTRQFQHPNLVDMVKRVLAETGLEPQFLELEVTETTAMRDLDFTRGILSELHDMGIRIAIDDFGTGYCSLSYLKKFPFDTIKIDQSFVRELTVDPSDAAIATAVMALGRALNLSVVAEGVETQEQLIALRNLQCKEMQGFFFSHPLSALDATRLLQSSWSRISNTFDVKSS